MSQIKKLRQKISSYEQIIEDDILGITLEGISLPKIKAALTQSQKELTLAEENRVVKWAFSGSIPWFIISIYALVWIHQDKHPDWALATTVVMGSILGILSLIVVSISAFLVWDEHSRA